MASQIYQQGKEGENLTGGWGYNYSLEGGRNMKMGVYSRTTEDKSTEYALVGRGTSSLGNWKDNLLQPFGKSPDMRASMSRAEEFVKDNPNNEVNHFILLSEWQG